jgi:hypothetical protein
MTHKPVVKFKEANRKDFYLMKQIMRNEDRRELEAASGKKFKDVVDKTQYNTDFAIAGYCDKKLIAIFGVTRITAVTKTGAIWMFGTKFLPENKKVFLKHCKKCIEVMIENYPIVYNFVDKRNIMIINWLKWLGFTFEDAKPYGPNGLLFYKFYMKNKCVGH